MEYSRKREVGVDTQREIHAAQAELERRVKEANRQRAGRLLVRYAADNEWPDADVEEVKGALGL